MQLKTSSKWLVVLAAIELGLIGVMNFDLIGSLLRAWPMAVKILYILIGAAGVWGAYAMATKKRKKR